MFVNGVSMGITTGSEAFCCFYSYSEEDGVSLAAQDKEHKNFIRRNLTSPARPLQVYSHEFTKGL